MLSIRIAVEAKRSRQPPWGDGLLDCGLNTLWHPCDWAEVADDELVLLIPALNGPASSNGQPHGAALRIAQRMADHLSAPYGPAWWHSGSVIRIDCSSDWLEENGAVGTWRTYFSPQAKLSCAPGSHPVPNFTARDLAGARAARIDTLCALATMDRMLYDSLSAPTSTLPLLGQRPPLADVVLATMLTRLHGTYVYPETSPAHELLTASAWLGVVLSGRPAIMPETVADVLIAYLDPAVALGTPDNARIHQIFVYCARLLGGTERLLHATSATRTKGPHLFRPPAAFAPGGTLAFGLWNAALRERIERQLTEREG